MDDSQTDIRTLAHRRADVHALNGAIRAGLQAAGLLAEVRARLDGDADPVTFDAAEFKDFDHGYATTVHKSQGATVDRSFVLAGPTMDRHLTYVAMTRHRNAATLYADSEAFGDRDGLMRRGIEEPAVPSLKETFLQFGSGAAAPPGPDAGERQAARRASLFARELALIGGAEPEARSDAMGGLSERLEAQGRRLAPEMAARQQRDVLKRCADADSPEMLAAWRSMEGWAKGRGFEFDRPEPRDGWSPPELRPPPVAEIMAARRAAENRRREERVRL